MMGKSHLLLGTAVGIGSAAILPLSLPHSALWIGIVSLCSLFPDLDGKGATLSRYLPPLSWLTRSVARLLYTLTATPRDAIEPRIHRGASHAPLYILALSAALYALLLPFVPSLALVVAAAFFVGNIAHLLGDAFSISGLPLLWPLRIKGKAWYDIRVPKPIRFRVGGDVELLFLKPLCYVLLYASIGLFIWMKGMGL